MGHVEDQGLDEPDEIGIPAVEMGRLTNNYWAEARGVGDSWRKHGFAMDVVDYLGLLVWRGVPGGNWEALYDIWLQRATQHALQAQALGRAD